MNSKLRGVTSVLICFKSEVVSFHLSQEKGTWQLNHMAQEEISSLPRSRIKMQINPIGVCFALVRTVTWYLTGLDP